MWFRTERDELINLDNVTAVTRDDNDNHNRYYVYFTDKEYIFISKNDRIDIEKLLMNRHALRFKEIRE